MTYSIIGTGNLGRTLAAFFAKAEVEVALANLGLNAAGIECRIRDGLGAGESSARAEAS